MTDIELEELIDNVPEDSHLPGSESNKDADKTNYTVTLRHGRERNTFTHAAEKNKVLSVHGLHDKKIS